MPTKSVKTLNANNTQILQATWAEAPYDYQQRVPYPDQGNITNTIKNILEYRPNMNEFVNTLVNKIGLTDIKSKIWSNPLAEFKRGMLNYGDTIEELATTIIQARRYDPNRDYQDVFKQERPDIRVNYHQINRQDYYPLTINEDLLRRAFREEYGLQDLVGRVMETPYTSDYWDEYLIMRNLFAEYEKRDGFYKVNVPDIDSATTRADKQDVASSITEAVRAQAGQMRFLSGAYNPEGVPSFTRNEDLILFTTPKFNAMLDVNVIAYAFNVSAADLKMRVIEVDSFNIDGCQAILVDRDFFMCADSLIEFTSINNPKALAWNYFLHHQGVYSVSRFVNAVMFTTEAGSTTLIPEIKVSDVSVAIAPLCDGTTPTFVEKGGKLRLIQTVTGTVTPVTDGYTVPQSVQWEITGTSDTNKATSTYIDQEGVLHVSENEENTSLTITATSVFYDPKVPTADQVYPSGSITIGIDEAYTPPTPTPTK